MFPFLISPHPVENCSTAVPGNGNGYLVTSLNPISSTEMEVTETDIRSTSADRNSGTFENPVYDVPQSMNSMESLRSPISGDMVEGGQNEERFSGLGSSLHSIALKQSNADVYTTTQTLPNVGRSHNSSDEFHGQCKGVSTNHKYDDIGKIRRHFRSKITTGVTEQCNRVDEEISDLTIEGENMVTVVNASYEALPCNTENIVKGKARHSVLRVTNPVTEYDHLSERMFVLSDIVSKKRPGYKSTFSVVDEQS